MKHNLAKTMSPGVKEIFEASLNAIMEYHDTFDRLSRQLARFETAIASRVSEGEVIELEIRRHLGRAKALLALCRANANREFVPYCLAAIDYLLHSEDNIPDFKSLDGFDDDAGVLAAVIKEFSLKIP